MIVSVVVPVHNRREITLRFLRQWQNVYLCGDTVQMLIVDDGSSDGTSEAIASEFPSTSILFGDGDLWWSGAINLGVRHAIADGAEAVLLMNDDLDLSPSVYSELRKVASAEPRALVSALKLYRDAAGALRVFSAGFTAAGRLLDVRVNGHGDLTEDTWPPVLRCDMLTGAALWIPSPVFESTGMLDSRRFPQAFGDIEFTWRASKRGWKCLVATGAHVICVPNPRYPGPFLLSSTRLQYLRHLFDNRRYSYGFVSLWHNSRVHRPALVGAALFLRRCLGLSARVVAKMLLPSQCLRWLFGSGQIRGLPVGTDKSGIQAGLNL